MYFGLRLQFYHCIAVVALLTRLLKNDIMDFSLYGILSWLDLADVKNLLAAQKESNIILLAYLLAYIKERKGCFIAAFLFSEFYGYVFLFSDMSHINFYLGYAIIYVALYFHLFNLNESLKTLFACVVIIMIDTWSALDAWLYPHTETFFYNAYPFIFMCVHFYIIISFVDWKPLSVFMGESINCITSLLGVSYSIELFWYTVSINHKKEFN